MAPVISSDLINPFSVFICCVDKYCWFFFSLFVISISKLPQLIISAPALPPLCHKMTRTITRITKCPALGHIVERCGGSYPGFTDPETAFGADGRTRTGDQQPFSRYTVINAKALQTELHRRVCPILTPPRSRAAKEERKGRRKEKRERYKTSHAN